MTPFVLPHLVVLSLPWNGQNRVDASTALESRMLRWLSLWLVVNFEGFGVVVSAQG